MNLLFIHWVQNNLSLHIKYWPIQLSKWFFSFYYALDLRGNIAFNRDTKGFCREQDKWLSFFTARSAPYVFRTELTISLSSQVLPLWREWKRSKEVKISPPRRIGKRLCSLLRLEHPVLCRRHPAPSLQLPKRRHHVCLIPLSQARSAPLPTIGDETLKLAWLKNSLCPCRGISLISPRPKACARSPAFREKCSQTLTLLLCKFLISHKDSGGQGTEIVSWWPGREPQEEAKGLKSPHLKEYFNFYWS